ncbi:MAG TPA: tetratricopeptide repeat protein [Vicinamibacterales bacterium]
MFRSLVAAFLALTVWLLPTSAMSQVLTLDTVADAQRLRDTGHFVAAAQVLRVLVAAHPDDGEAIRLLAQTLYWLKDVSGARETYEMAIARHPQDTTARMQYARMLAETKDAARARTLLKPLVEVTAVRADAETLMGLIAYWDGDYAGARRLFLSALQSNPDQDEARRSLQEIRAISAPWVRVLSGGWHDNQPLDNLAFGVEASWSARPLTSLTARLESTQYQLADLTRTINVAEFALKHYAAPARLELEITLGTIRRAQGADLSEWTGRASAGVRLRPYLTLRGRAERTPYLHTTTSIDTPVMVQTLTGLLQLNQRGWAGEAAYQREQYPDDNATRTAYGWILAPLSPQQHAAAVQAGYAFSYSDADATRFALASPTQPFLPSDPRFSLVGHYMPYYTPNQLVTHAVIGAIRLGPARGTTVHFDGSYALRATDNAPYFFVLNGQVAPGTYPRTLTPWRGRAAIDITVHNGLTLTPTGEIARTVFYSSATAGLQLTYRFNAAPPRPSKP